MSESVILDPKYVHAEWLTEVLRKSGALEAGAVTNWQAETTARELSTNCRIWLDYTPGARGPKPHHLFLKIVHTDHEDEFFGPSEVHYYTRDYVRVEGVPLPRVYHAAYSEARGCYHILMDDLSATHHVTSKPTLDHGLALVEGLAAMHAHWWGVARLEEANAPIPDAGAVHRFVEMGRLGAEHIIEGCADQLKPRWPDAIRAIFAEHPRLLVERTRDPNGFTLIHGDAGWTNILVPLQGSRPIYLIDRQPFDWSLTTWLGVYDLAYAIVLKWDIEDRRHDEQVLLHHYHDHLIRHGVRGYSYEQLYEDYRLAVVMGVYVATEWCRGGLNKETMMYWMPKLQRSLVAFDDLDCANLWM